MMQVPSEIRKCVVFLAYEDKSGVHMAGTGFFVSVTDTKDPFIEFIYLVTARHVVVAALAKSVDQSLIVRINTESGGYKYVKIAGDSWKYHDEDTAVDLAVCPWRPQNHYEFMCIGDAMIVTENFVNKHNVGIGDDLFTIGLFASHLGRQRNVPICRIGNIAAMPEERVSTDKFGDMEAYIIEARSIGGLSGSPVFIYIPSNRKVIQDGKPTNIMGRAVAIGLLGVIHGHWDVKNDTVVDYAMDEVTKMEGRVNMGMAIVTPATKLREILYSSTLASLRDHFGNIAREKLRSQPSSSSETLA